MSTDLEGAIPGAVHGLLETLWAGGHAAYVVGGSLRDTLLGRPAYDWDLATAALPERTRRAVPGRRLREQVRDRGGGDQRPGGRRGRDHDVPLGPRLRRLPPAASGRVQRLDRARPRQARLHRQRAGLGRRARRRAAARRSARRPGRPRGADCSAPSAIPRSASREDALRMVRAVRLVATLDFEIEPATLDAIRAKADLVRHLSGERIAAEMTRLLAADKPSIGLRLMADTGPAAATLPGACRATGRAAEQGRRTRTSGITRSARSMARSRSRPASASRPCSTTSASR